MTARAQTENTADKDRVLVCGVNWLGDAVMSIPALGLFRREKSGCDVSILVKRRMAELWRMTDCVNEVLVYDPGSGGTLAAARLVREGGFDRAFVLPNSFRSALIPFLGRVPVRIGVGTQLRSSLLTGALRPAADGLHQAFEYLRILGLEAPDGGLPAPALSLPSGAVLDAELRLARGKEGRRRLVGFLPGAARGPAKRWPEEHFVALGRELVGRAAVSVVVFGSRPETGLCERVADGIGANAFSTAGQTGISQLAAMLRCCDAVVTNDSGGMHLAAAAGTRVVAVFGLTDPSRTGPLGEGHRVIARKNVPASRDIRRRSAAAAACLRSIAPEQVLEAVLEVLG